MRGLLQSIDRAAGSRAPPSLFGELLQRSRDYGNPWRQGRLAMPRVLRRSAAPYAPPFPKLKYPFRSWMTLFNMMARQDERPVETPHPAGFYMSAGVCDLISPMSWRLGLMTTGLCQQQGFAGSWNIGFMWPSAAAIAGKEYFIVGSGPLPAGIFPDVVVNWAEFRRFPSAPDPVQYAPITGWAPHPGFRLPQFLEPGATNVSLFDLELEDALRFNKWKALAFPEIYQVGPQPDPSPVPSTGFVFSGNGGGRTRPPKYRRKPPAKGEREVKWATTAGRAMMVAAYAASLITESRDFVSAIYEALPDHRKRSGLAPHEKALAILRHLDEVDPGQAILNLVIEGLLDRIGAFISDQEVKALDKLRGKPNDLYRAVNRFGLVSNILRYL